MRIACIAAALASRGKATRMVSCVQTPTPPLLLRGGVGVCLQATRMAGSPPNSHTQKTIPPAAQVTMREMASIEPRRQSRIVQRC